MPTESRLQQPLRISESRRRHDDVPGPGWLPGAVDRVEEEWQAPPERLGRLLRDLRVDASRLEDCEHGGGVAVTPHGSRAALAARTLVGRLAGEQRQHEDEHGDGDEGVKEEQWTYLRLTCSA
jgi:hypothetical protein